MKILLFLGLIVLFSCEKPQRDCCLECFISTTYLRPGLEPPKVIIWAGPFLKCDSLEKATADDWVKANTYEDKERNMKQIANCR